VALSHSGQTDIAPQVRSPDKYAIWIRRYSDRRFKLRLVEDHKPAARQAEAEGGASQCENRRRLPPGVRVTARTAMNASLGTNMRRHLRISHTFIALVELLSAGLAQADTNLLDNGSFETPSVPAGKHTDFAGGSSGISTWTVVGRQTSLVNQKLTSFQIQFPASDGLQWLDLTGFHTNNVGGIEQTVPTVAGKAYHLSFAVGNVFDPRGIYGTTSTVAVTINGIPLGKFTNSCGTCTHILTWQTFTASFVPSSPTTVIRFLNADPPTDNSNGLDNVVLTGAL
jgi:hypothetical protein